MGLIELQRTYERRTKVKMEVPLGSPCKPTAKVIHTVIELHGQERKPSLDRLVSAYAIHYRLFVRMVQMEE